VLFVSNYWKRYSKKTEGRRSLNICWWRHKKSVQ